MELQADKGQKDGSCNRTACQQPGATWFNRFTQAYYCPSCAFLINRANRDLVHLGPMCVGPEEPHVPAYAVNHEATTL